jgi:ubiquinol-cytochrome c reductase cytochrome c1 subunit
MKRLLTLSFLFCLAVPALAAEEMPYAVKLDRGNTASLQRGARDFMNYCSGCHGMQYLRYTRLAKDLDIPEDVLKKNLMFTSDKVGDQIHTSMPAQAADWFGKQPPDLTLETRARGAEWVYNYLLTFYLDPKRPNGVNNMMLPNVSMPHVLWELQGWQKLAGEKEEKGEGAGEQKKPQFEQVQPGQLSPDEYKKWVADLVNFMDYAAEPEKAERMRIGVRVLIYLVVFLLPLTYLLKREYWKDVH